MGPVTIPRWGEHDAGPSDCWQGAYKVGDSWRLTCAAEGRSICFDRGADGVTQECGYWIDGTDSWDCPGIGS